MLLFDCYSTAIKPVFRIAAKLVHILQYVLPILLIVLIIFDVAKLVTTINIDDKAKKSVLEKAAKRLLYAVIIFLIPTIINYFLSNVFKATSEDNKNNNWLACWTHYYNETK